MDVLTAMDVEKRRNLADVFMEKLMKNPDVLKQIMAIQKDRMFGELNGIVEWWGS